MNTGDLKFFFNKYFLNFKTGNSVRALIFLKRLFTLLLNYLLANASLRGCSLLALEIRNL